jgi:hypothetical protein
MRKRSTRRAARTNDLVVRLAGARQQQLAVPVLLAGNKIMNRYFVALTVLAAAFPASGIASEHKGWVYGGLTGWSTASDGDLGDGNFGSNSSIGYRWGRVGIEVGHSYFGKFNDNSVAGGIGVDVDEKIDGWNAGINFNHDLDEKWSMQGRIGVFDWHSDGHAAAGGSRLGFSDSGSDWYAGLSVDHKWRRRSGIGLGYTYFKADNASIHLWGVHSEFRF